MPSFGLAPDPQSPFGVSDPPNRIEWCSDKKRFAKRFLGGNTTGGKSATILAGSLFAR